MAAVHALEVVVLAQPEVDKRDSWSAVARQAEVAVAVVVEQLGLQLAVQSQPAIRGSVDPPGSTKEVTERWRKQVGAPVVTALLPLPGQS